MDPNQNLGYSAGGATMGAPQSFAAPAPMGQQTQFQGANPFLAAVGAAKSPSITGGITAPPANGPPATGASGWGGSGGWTPPAGGVSSSGGATPAPSWRPQPVGGGMQTGMPAPMQMGPLGPMIHDGQQWQHYNPADPAHVSAAYGGQIPPNHPVLGGVPGGARWPGSGPGPDQPFPGQATGPGSQHTWPVNLGPIPTTGGQPPVWKGNPGAQPTGLSPHQQYEQWVQGGRQGASGANLPSAGQAPAHPGGFNPRFPGGGIGANPPDFRPPATLPFQPGGPISDMPTGQGIYG